MKLWQLTPAEDLGREMKGCCFKAKCLLKRIAFILPFFFLLISVTLLVQYRNFCPPHRVVVATRSGTLQINEICNIFNLSSQHAVLGMQCVRKTKSEGCEKCSHTGNWNCAVIHSCSIKNPFCNLSFLILVWLEPDLPLVQTGAAQNRHTGLLQETICSKSFQQKNQEGNRCRWIQKQRGLTKWRDCF